MEAIICRDLGKRYAAGSGARYQTFRETLAGMVGRRADSPSIERWALRHIDIAISPGEVVGLIGGNGAGKSTLLKMLSRITAPTEGRIELKGRVGSLLEVGTGFHPELTGRENIYLAGAVIGMTRREIDQSFDRIVAFSEVGGHLDVPVKRYSSGMFTRLAFAVAAHLETEVLLVDEVLAVGDARFQARCLGRMEEVGRQGRTIIFVSHNMGAVRRLCPRVLWFDQGRLRRDGEGVSVVSEYLRESQVAAAGIPEGGLEDPLFRWTSVEVVQDGLPAAAEFNGSPVEVRIGFRLMREQRGFRILIDLHGDEQELIFRSLSDERDAAPAPVAAGDHMWTVTIPADVLADRPQWLTVQATIFEERMLGNPVRIRIDVHRSTAVNAAYPTEPVRGLILPPTRWARGGR